MTTDEIIEKGMSSLRKLWLVFSIVCVAVSYEVIIATQGGSIRLGIRNAIGVQFADDVPEAIAGLWGIILLSIFGLIANAIFLIHAQKTTTGWAERIPFRLLDVAPTTSVGQVGQVLAVVVFTLAPAYFLAHSWRVMLNHGILCIEVTDANWQPRAVGDRAFFRVPVDAELGPLRLTSSENVRRGTGPALPTNPQTCERDRMEDYYGPAQSWVMAAFSVAMAGLLVLVLVIVFQPATVREKRSGSSRSG